MVFAEVCTWFLSHGGLCHVAVSVMMKTAGTTSPQEKMSGKPEPADALLSPIWIILAFDVSKLLFALLEGQWIVLKSEFPSRGTSKSFQPGFIFLSTRRRET